SRKNARSRSVTTVPAIPAMKARAPIGADYPWPPGGSSNGLIEFDLSRKPVPTPDRVRGRLFGIMLLVLLHDALAADDFQIAAEVGGLGLSRERPHVRAVKGSLLGDSHALDVGFALAEHGGVFGRQHFERRARLFLCFLRGKLHHEASSRRRRGR